MDENIKLENVAKIRQVNLGFKQSYLIHNNYEILFNDIKFGADFQPHSHEFAQFVYCFEGKFLLTADGEEFCIEPSNTFNIAPNVFHDVKVLEDIVTFDFKYINENYDSVNQPKVDFDIFQGEQREFLTQEVKVLMLSSNDTQGEIFYFDAGLNKDNFVLAVQDTEICLNEEKYSLSEMSINRIECTGGSQCRIKHEDKASLIFIIQLSYK